MTDDALAELLTLTQSVDPATRIIYYMNSADQLHRAHGPAMIYPSGEQRWFYNGELHRVDGPAIEFANGYRMWVLMGKTYSWEMWRLLVDAFND